MEIPSFHITPDMRNLFSECVKEGSYKLFYDLYKSEFEDLAVHLKTVRLPEDTVLHYCVSNFMECVEYLIHTGRGYNYYGHVFSFYRDVDWAILNGDWSRFYWKFRDSVDYVIKKAREQRKIQIYVVEGSARYSSFRSRDRKNPKENSPETRDFEKKSQERENRRRELEEELRKLDLEEKEQLAMISNFKSPEPELQPISPPPSIHDDLINDMDGGMFGSEKTDDSSLEDLQLHVQEMDKNTMLTENFDQDQEELKLFVQELEQNAAETINNSSHQLENALKAEENIETEISEEEASDDEEEDNFHTMLQEQAARHKEEMEKVMKKRAEQKKKLEELNRKVNAIVFYK
ncbi:Cilia- and flagella-associated protein 251-like [Caenorhabditis elegans]|uniref:Cilia- and flagella-associated protein 251-like n=2 Tax=Caenorhabditis elegans TaxID=6239 RepID=A0A0K3ARN3_CAEEL|nr:Cilia- and flagella-associated protein 251-like [Caenorhabditis elegans]CTQ86696.1 Cilia- and flagella-associated protein 251-like [Caenorhabditis elegans]|eukprot:NP_001299997.1 Uncharacterized protein CELE_K02E2.7 [Caenorhabditis elegans]